MMTRLLAVLALLGGALLFVATPAQTDADANPRVRISTNAGDITVELYPDEAPLTVANFLSYVDSGFYAGTVFHRVIPNFMIQGGCPLGTGTGGPGYQFQDEIAPSLKFDKPGLLAMANAGPGTNGSQFFITHAATEWLTGRHTIFGEVTEGMDVVTAIGNVEKGPGDRPKTPVVIKKITIQKVK